MAQKEKKTSLRTIGYILIGLQMMSYLGSLGKPGRLQAENSAERAGQMVGQNLFLIIGVILLIAAYRKERKAGKDEMKKLIDSIGKED